MPADIYQLVREAKAEIMQALQAHANDDNLKFSAADRRMDRVFEVLKNMDEKSDRRDEKRDLQYIETQKTVAQLWDIKNQNDGAENQKAKSSDLMRYMASGLGAVFLVVIGAALAHYWP